MSISTEASWAAPIWRLGTAHLCGWGHQNISNTNLRDDELLTDSQAFLTQLVDYSRLRNQFHRNNKLLSDWSYCSRCRES
jgi:hypothetical protein